MIQGGSYSTIDIMRRRDGSDGRADRLYRTGQDGAGLIEVLLEDGHEVCGFDVDEERKRMLADAGGRPLDSGQEVAENADIVCSILLKPEHIEENAFGERGVVSAGRAGLVYIEMSTMPPGWQADLANRLGAHGIEMLDCPISGSHPKVMDRTITMMVGGKKEVFERVRPVFEPITAGFDYTGESGTGATMKIVTNLFRERVGGASGGGDPHRRAGRTLP